MLSDKDFDEKDYDKIYHPAAVKDALNNQDSGFERFDLYLYKRLQKSVPNRYKNLVHIFTKINFI